jgi:tetratricopeptide (TPR) repeat protein
LRAFLRAEAIALAGAQQDRTENALLGKLYLELGHAYLRLWDTPHARAAMEHGRALDSSPELLEELAGLYRAAGDLRQAAMALLEAMAVDPNGGALAPTVVELYGQYDPLGCSVTREGVRPSLNTGCPLVHGDICAASRNVIANYRRQGRPFEADSARKTAELDLGCAPQLLN